jgi:hypothetical protein
MEKEKVTILGSERQYSIAHHYPTTSILSDLNYPHYSKEILQQIRYLKYKNIDEENTKYCFRRGLLSHCQNSVDDSLYQHLKKQFDDTSLFVIEIASRRSYEWNGLYLHHIAEEDSYHFYDRENIIKRDLTDEEIEEDILQIRKELYPRKLIILSHFSTYQHGKRYELIQLIKNICMNANIPFIDQSLFIEKYGKDNMLVDERVLAHYTDYGHQRVGEELKNRIEDFKKKWNEEEEKNKKYQVYYTDKEKVQKYGFHGFGDYIRGCISLYIFSKDHHFPLEINFSNHPLQHVFYCKNELSIEECKDIRYIFNTSDGILESKRIFTNNCHRPYIGDDCKKYIIDNCLTPRISFTNKLNQIKGNLGLEKDNYIVIHIRLDDNEEYHENRFQNIQRHILNIQNENKNCDKFLLMSSKSIYMDKINLPNTMKTNLERGHTGLNNTSSKEIEDTMIEFFLMIDCCKIYQLSMYDWGSGFSDTIQKLFEKNIDRIKI